MSGVQPRLRTRDQARGDARRKRAAKYEPTKTADQIIRSAYKMRRRGVKDAIQGCAWALQWPVAQIEKRADELGVSC